MAPLDKIAVYCRVPGTQWQEYLNYASDAFRNAAATLRARMPLFTSQQLQSWVSAQDAVFSNCAGDGSVPPEAPPGSPALLKADRAYQIGAAQRRRATEEWDRLSRIDTAPNYLGQADEVLVSVNRLFTDTAAPVAPLSDSAPLRCPRAGPGSPISLCATAVGRGIGSTGGITVRGQRPR